MALVIRKSVAADVASFIRSRQLQMPSPARLRRNGNRSFPDVFPYSGVHRRVAAGIRAGA
jgi:hypothetical protein